MPSSAQAARTATALAPPPSTEPPTPEEVLVWQALRRLRTQNPARWLALSRELGIAPPPEPTPLKKPSLDGRRNRYWEATMPPRPR